VAKPGAQLVREIQEALGLPPAIVKKWRSKISAYKRAVATMEAGYTEDAFRAMVRARDALDKAIYEAGAHVPYVADEPAHLSPAILALEKERVELLGKTWLQAQERGREVKRRAGEAEIKRLKEEEREAKRPYEWMRR
jgi:hypothetical protein